MGVFLVLLGGIFWAISGVLAEYLFKNNYGVDWVSFYRLFCTGIVLILYSLKKIKIFQFKKDELLSFLIFAFFGLLMTQYGYFKAIFYTDAGTATMIQYRAPLLIMIYVCLKDKKMPKIFESMALIFIILALFLLASGGDISNLNLNLWGIFWAILGAFGVAFYSLGARKIIAKYGIFFVMGWSSLIASFILFGILEFKEGLAHYDFALNLYLAQAGIIFIGTIGAFCLYLKGVEIHRSFKSKHDSMYRACSSCFYELFIFRNKIQLFRSFCLCFNYLSAEK